MVCFARRHLKRTTWLSVKCRRVRPRPRSTRAFRPCSRGVSRVLDLGNRVIFRLFRQELRPSAPYELATSFTSSPTLAFDPLLLPKPPPLIYNALRKITRRTPQYWFLSDPWLSFRSSLNVTYHPQIKKHIRISQNVFFFYIALRGLARPWTKRPETSKDDDERQARNRIPSNLRLRPARMFGAV